MAVEAIKSAAASMAMKPVEIVKPVTIEPVTTAVAEPNVAVKEVQGSAKNNANEEKGHGEGREGQASKGQIKSAVSHANNRLKKTGCQFSYHEETKRVSITVIDNGRGIPVGINPQKGIPTVTVVFTIQCTKKPKFV